MKFPSINETGLLLYLDAGLKSSKPPDIEYFGSSAWSQSGLTSFIGSRVNNGLTDLGDNCFDASTAGVGSYLKLDATTPKNFTQVRWTNSANTHSHGIWSIQYSDNGSDWSDAATGFDVGTNGTVMKSWTSVGAHRYWQLYKTDAAVAGNYCYEVQFLDATWKDLSGNGYNATLNGTTYSTSGGGSLVFNGTSDYGQTTATPFTGNTDFTFCLWAKSTAAVNGASIFCNKGYNTTGEGAGVQYRGGGATVSTVVMSNTPVTANADHSLTNPFTWAYIVGVRDSNHAKSYKNGAYVTTSVLITGTVTDQINYFMIGATYAATPIWFFAGSISQILVYQRALSAAEILQNYNASKQRFV